MAKLYWFFCYYGNGMNTKDVAYLRYKNISDGFITFTRAKTEKTTKCDPKLIMVYLKKSRKSSMKLGRIDNNTFLFQYYEMALIHLNSIWLPKDLQNL